MANPWFKFYGGDYLNDPKMDDLTACERICWITLLALANLAEENGIVRYVDEYKLMVKAGLSPMREELEKTKGVLNHFKKLRMITICNGVITVSNWEKRQEIHSESYDRLKKWREKKRIETEMKQNDNGKNRTEQNRTELNPPEAPKTAGFVSKEKYLKNMESKASANSRVFSQKQSLAAEISAWGLGFGSSSGDALKIPMLMALIKLKGEQFVRECYASARQSNARDPAAIFMSEYGKVKIIKKQ